MQLSLEVSFPNANRRQAVEKRVGKRAATVENFTDRVMSCRGMVEVPNGRPCRGGPSPLRVDLQALGHWAFGLFRRRLKDGVCRLDRALASMADYGIILASNGREIYFHRNGFLGADFDRFEAAGEDRFAEEQGGKGLRPAPCAQPADVTW